MKIYQAIARRIEDNFARRERCRKLKKESTTIKTNITAIDKKYLVVNLPELNIYPVSGGNDCTYGSAVVGVWCIGVHYPTLTALAVALYSGWLIVSLSGSSLTLTW